MDLSILGKTRKGRKDFFLKAEKNRSYRIEALKYRNNEVTKFTEITSIDWTFKGQAVKLNHADGTTSLVDFRYTYDEVKITEVALKAVVRTKATTLGQVEAGTDFTFGGVVFTKGNYSQDEQDGDVLLSCNIKDQQAKVLIAAAALVEIEI
jgi:hypothetical protein